MTEQLYGWRGKVLWVDCATKTSRDLDISYLCKNYIGARGLAAKLAWDYLKPGTSSFDDGNLLMFFNGPVCGSNIPGCGRGYIFGIGPETYPEHFTRSSVGGRWASGLKFCGYDGLILENKCDDKTILEITDDGVVFHDATSYWGHDIQYTQEKIRENFGEDVDALVIGQAGERLIRFAAVMTLANNAAGQGGFGAVMGDKKVKAIVFNGTQPVPIRDLAAQIEMRNHMFHISPVPYKEPYKDPAGNLGPMWYSAANLDEEIAEGNLKRISYNYNACRGCGFGAYTCCGGGNFTFQYQDMKPVYNTNALSGGVKCVEPMAWGWNVDVSGKSEYDWITEGTGRTNRWPVDFQRGNELVHMWNSYGLNAWEVCFYLQFFTELESIGIDIEELTGMEWDVNDRTCFQRMLVKMVNREPGFAYDMGEGIARLGIKLGSPYREHSTHCINGYCDHAIGTTGYANFKYPYWIVSCLLFATDNRDPYSDSGHRFSEFVWYSAENEEYNTIAKEVWGDELAIGPRHELRKVNGGTMDDDEFDDLAYSYKEHVAVQLQNRSVVIGSGVFCDGVYPRYRGNGSAQYANGEDFRGDYDAEAKVLTAVTGVEYTTKQLEAIGEKVLNIERCYNVLEWGRNKAHDMSICDNIHPRGDWTTGKKIDKERFSALLGRYYTLRGWDEDGIPTEEKLLALGLKECNEMMKPFRK